MHRLGAVAVETANLPGRMNVKPEEQEKKVTGIIDNEMMWRQFGVAIDLLGSALRDCPDDLWEERLWPDEPDQ
jgi:hypothetical protein